MNKFFSITKVLIVYFLITSGSFSADFYSKGKILFEKKQFDKSKFLFEKDIVFNPKSEMSYLYLAKIFKEKQDDLSQELNLNSVLILNPKNEEAVYLLTLLKIKQYDYSEAKILIEKFNLICTALCSNIDEIKEKLSKLKPEDAENKN